jgi:hypothetical protein
VIGFHEIPEGTTVERILINGQETWKAGEELSDEERRRRVKEALGKDARAKEDKAFLQDLGKAALKSSGL